MSQMPEGSAADRRLRILRFGLMLLPVLTFTIVTGLLTLASVGTGLINAALQGALWGAGAAVLAAIVYRVYKSMIAKG